MERSEINVMRETFAITKLGFLRYESVNVERLQVQAFKPEKGIFCFGATVFESLLSLTVSVNFGELQ